LGVEVNGTLDAEKFGNAKNKFLEIEDMVFKHKMFCGYY